MTDEPLPPDDPHTGELARQKLALWIALVAIGLSAVVALVMLKRFPLPLRIFIAVGDLAVMATLWLVMRQKFSGK